MNLVGADLRGWHSEKGLKLLAIGPAADKLTRLRGYKKTLALVRAARKRLATRKLVSAELQAGWERARVLHCRWIRTSRWC